MEESKVQYRSEEEITRHPGNPPSYTSGPPPGPYPAEPPGLYGPHGMPAAPAVVGVGVVGTNVGMVGTAVAPVMIVHQISPKPTRVVCKSCHSEIVTRVEQKANMKTHLFAFLLFIFGCWCCCCIPYCTDSCMNSDHYCPNCNAYIGSYNS